jgi:hypothetical protein
LVFFDVRVDQLATMCLEAIERAFLVGPHQPRVARHIGGENRGETAFDRLFLRPSGRLKITQRLVR